MGSILYREGPLAPAQYDIYEGRSINKLQNGAIFNVYK